MVLLVNTRGGVVSVKKPRAEQLLKQGFKEAPEGVKAGQYLPGFDVLAKPPKPVKTSKKSAPKKATSKKSASSKKSK